VFVQGPYLVRSALVTKQGLELTGDIANATSIGIFAPKSACSSSVKWNGIELKVKQEKGGMWTAQLSKARTFSLPALSGWKYTDGLPEIQTTYAATSSAWIGMSN